MMKPVLYSTVASPPCRAVLVAAHALGVNLEIKMVNLMNRDNFTEEFLKMNPKHTIPVLDDNGFILTDSHVIISYLADNYGKDDSLYPRDVQIRALVNQYLYFDMDYLFKALKNAFKPLLYNETESISEEKMQMFRDAHELLDKQLQGKKWLVGNSYTLADISCASTVSSSSVVLNLDDYPNVKAWLQLCEAKVPGYKEHNLPGNKMLHELVLKRLGQ